MIPYSEALTAPSERKPRASGDDPQIIRLTADRTHVNPARAGMIPPYPHYIRRITRKPRASGDDPRQAGIARQIAG